MAQVMIPLSEVLSVLNEIKSDALKNSAYWSRKVTEFQEGDTLRKYTEGRQDEAKFVSEMCIQHHIDYYTKKEASATEAEAQTKSSTDSLPHTCEQCESPCETVQQAYNGCRIDICEDCANSDDFQQCDKCNALTHTSDLEARGDGDLVCISCIDLEDSSKEWYEERQISEYREGWGHEPKRQGLHLDIGFEP